MKVVISADGLTPDDFTRAGCDQALAASPRRWNHDTLIALHRRQEAAQGEGDERTVAVCLLLHAVLASRAPWNNTAPPAEDDSVLPTYELDEGAFAYLGQILSLIKDDEVRSRAADLLYQHSIGSGRKRDIAAAAAAVRAYLAEAVHLEGPDGSRWPYAKDRVERAFCITAELQHAALKREVLTHVERALIAFSAPIGTERPAESAEDVRDGRPSRYPAVLMKLLLRFKEGDPLRHGTLAERLAQEALAFHHWELGRTYLELAAQWHRRSGDNARELAAQELAAESWVTEGEQPPDAQAHFFLQAEHKLLQGIQDLRATKKQAKEYGYIEIETRLTTRIEELRWLHLRYQERGVEALVPIRVSDTVDSGPIFTAVQGKSKMEALHSMTAFALPSRGQIEAEVREDRETNPLSSLLGLVQMDERGHNTARDDGGTGNSDLWARMCQRAAMSYTISAQLYVGPLIWRVGLDHAIGVEDFALLAKASPFVPPGREPLFASGLNAGMQSDFGLAVHLLIPQVEHALREIVRTALASDERLTKTHSATLADEEAPSLAESLCRSAFAVELSRILGDDIVFALRVILIERFGENLRHRVMHGLVKSHGVEGFICWYFWWLVLKMCWTTATAASSGTSSE